MRTYSGLLILEDIFDFIPNTDPDISNLAASVFTPNILIAENDCGTTLGKFENLNFESEGLIELSTGLPLSKTRIEFLLSQGIYEIAIRHTSTCITKNGICKTCYEATYPDVPEINVLDFVSTTPDYYLAAEIIPILDSVNTYNSTFNLDGNLKIRVYIQGQLLVNNVDYKIENELISNGDINDPEDDIYLYKVILLDNSLIVEGNNIVLRVLAESRIPFVSWLSRTYSGSILGMKPLPSQELYVRSLYLSSYLSENRLQLISEILKSDKKIPSDYSGYVDSIKNNLEKALYMLAIYSIYSNVVN